MTRVKYLSEWTVRTKSDHLALFVKVELRWRDRRGRKHTVELVLGTANAGGYFDATDLNRLLLTGVDVLAIQEGSDQTYVRRVAARHGYRVLDGSGGGQVGQAATLTLVGPRVVDRGPAKWVRLLGAINWGPGAGPSKAKPKWWLRNRLAVAADDGTKARARFGASSVHFPPTQGKLLRFRAALTMARILLSSLAIPRPMFLLGDLNSSFKERFSRWMLAHGWTNNHAELGEVHTHEHRSIDMVAVQARLTD